MTGDSTCGLNENVFFLQYHSHNCTRQGYTNSPLLSVNTFCPCDFWPCCHGLLNAFHAQKDCVDSFLRKFKSTQTYGQNQQTECVFDDLQSIWSCFAAEALIRALISYGVIFPKPIILFQSSDAVLNHFRRIIIFIQSD